MWRLWRFGLLWFAVHSIAILLRPRNAAGQNIANGSRPNPTNPNVEEWDFVRSAWLASNSLQAWEQLEDPEVFLRMAFGHLAYTVERSSPGSTTFIVELPSGEEMFLDVEEESGKDDRYHLFKIVGHTGGIFRAGFLGGPILQDSELLLWVTSTPGLPNMSTVEIAWLGIIEPDNNKEEINAVLDGLILTMLDNLRVQFGAGDCLLKPFERTMTGVCNNQQHPSWGMPLTLLRRLNENDPAYNDGATSPSGGDISARVISNAVCDQKNNGTDDATNANQLTDLFVFFGQFIDHDLDLSPTGVLSSPHQPLFDIGSRKLHEKMPIPIPENDPFMAGLAEMKFERAAWARLDNEDLIPRQHLNQLSSFLDLGQVYGSSQIRARILRMMQGGQLKTSAGSLLPKNGEDIEGSIGLSLNNDPDASSDFYVAGDVRANENILLTALHVLWLREHNKVASELAEALPEYGDEQLFSTARSIVIAEYQSIVYNEWLSRLLGPTQVPARDHTYNATVDPSISTFFSTAAFRFGHSMVNNFLWVIDGLDKEQLKDPQANTTVPLREAFFNPRKFREMGVDGLLLGAAWHYARELDVKIVDDLRNFLFSENKSDKKPDQDLASINIQRGRDMGLPAYNDAREAYGLPRFRGSDFRGITRNVAVAKLLEDVYGDVNKIDAFVGGLAEDHRAGSIVGPLFFAAIKDQFQRLRDADRFFYKNLVISPKVMSAYPRLRNIMNDEIQLADIIVRNTGISRRKLIRTDRSSIFEF